jgi:hypothetical protein
MHAQIANLVTCAAPLCVQPGESLHVVGPDSEGNDVALEFCDSCLVRIPRDAETAPEPPVLPQEAPETATRTDDPPDGSDDPPDDLVGV